MPMNNFGTGIRWYTEGIARFAVYFPEGECVCRVCPYCYSRPEFGNFKCGLMDVYIAKVDLNTRHPICPIEFQETEF